MSIRAQVAPIQHVKKVWERIAPLHLADKSWDNVGVMIESPVPNEQNKQVLLTIDLTTAVCAEALALPACSVVVSYHPPIFRGLKSLTLSDPLQASLLRLSAKGISVFSPHTSLDAAPNGINTWLVEPFQPHASSSKPIVDSTSDLEGAGMGKFVQLKKGLPMSEIVQMIKKHLSLDHVQISTPDEERPIESIAVCAGSGASMFKNVKADLYFTGEMSHHEVLAARAEGTAVILTNHSNSERPYLTKVLQSWLQKELNEVDESGEKQGGGWEVLVSKSDADPLRTV